MRKPSQKTGIEKPPTAKTITPRSIQVPARHAASTPSGMASPTAKTSVDTASASVGSSRWAISVRTGKREWSDRPRSPRARLATYDAELDVDRLVEPESGADLRDGLRRRVVPGDDGRGIAGGEPEQDEDEQHDDGHDREDGEDAADGVGEHGRDAGGGARGGAARGLRPGRRAAATSGPCSRTARRARSTCTPADPCATRCSS